jgi:hypothetical protein
VAGVVAASPALCQSPGDSAPGAFDDRQDFVRNDVFSRRSALARIPVRLDCGRDDPFIVASRAFTRGLPSAAATFDAGAHTEEYWSAHAGAQMAWLRKQFASPVTSGPPNNPLTGFAARSHQSAPLPLRAGSSGDKTGRVSQLAGLSHFS